MTATDPERTGAQNRAARLRLFRDAHRLIGLFIAPSVMFFALTGFAQLIELHEAHGAYKPPAVLEKLSQVHIHQKFAAKPERPRPPGAVAAHDDHEHEHADAGEEHATPIGVTLLRALFVLVSIGLFASSTLGVWIALARPQRTVTFAVLGAGTVLPILFALLSGG